MSSREFSLDNFTLPLDALDVSGGNNDDFSEVMGGDSLEDIFSVIDDDEYSEYEDYQGNHISSALGDDGSIHMDSNMSDDGDYDDDYFGNMGGSDEPIRETLDIDAILGKAVEMRASDVHISSDAHVAFTILGEIVHMKEFGILPSNSVQYAYTEITSNVAQSDFATNLDLDTSYMIKRGKYKGRRFRLSVGRSFATVFMVFRVISDTIPTPKDLGIPSSIEKWTQLPNGLVLICGPTGTGKSTTFASLINQINLSRSKKIITVERPVEYVYPSDGIGLITQREVGKDTRSFASALTAAMRQAPDVIMIGEVRDREEVDAVLRASESGHLAFSTMHTNSPPGTINRIKSLYQGDEQLRVLASLRDNVRGIANQVLVKTKNGNDRFAIHCVLDVTPEVAEMIGSGRVDKIQEYMMEREETMEHRLVEAVLKGKCRPEEARNYCVFPEIFDDVLRSRLRKR